MTIVQPRSSWVVVTVLPLASVVVETARALPPEFRSELLELDEDETLTDELDEPEDDALAALRPGDVLALVEPSSC